MDEYISMSIHKYYQTGTSIADITHAVSFCIPMYCPQLCFSILFLPSLLLCSLCLRYCDTHVTDTVKRKKENNIKRKKKKREREKRKKKREREREKGKKGRIRNALFIGNELVSRFVAVDCLLLLLFLGGGGWRGREDSVILS